MTWVTAYILPLKSEWQYTIDFPASDIHFRVSGVVNPQPLPYLICQAEDTDKFDIRKTWVKDDAEIFTFVQPEFFATRRLGIKVIWREGFLSASATVAIKVWRP